MSDLSEHNPPVPSKGRRPLPHSCTLLPCRYSLGDPRGFAGKSSSIWEWRQVQPSIYSANVDQMSVGWQALF